MLENHATKREGFRQEITNDIGYYTLVMADTSMTSSFNPRVSTSALFQLSNNYWYNIYGMIHTFLVLDHTQMGALKWFSFLTVYTLPSIWEKTNQTEGIIMLLLVTVDIFIVLILTKDPKPKRTGFRHWSESSPMFYFRYNHD